MVLESVAGLVLAFVFVVAATYVGATAALRQFFGREYYDPATGQFTAPYRRSDGDERNKDGETAE